MTVTLFSLTTCTMCSAMEIRLKTKGIRYEKIMIDDKPEIREELTAAGHLAMPVVRAERAGQKVLEFAGFSDGSIKRLHNLVFAS